MKISIISHFPPVKGGISIYSKKIAEEFSKQKQSVNCINVNSVLDLLNIPIKLYKFKPEIIRLDYTISMYGIISICIFIILLIYKIINKIPIVVNYHEVKRDTDLLGKFGIYYYQLVSNFFDFIFVHTYEGKNILINLCKISSAKISVNPLPLYSFKEKKELKSFFNNSLFHQKEYILYFGYIHVDKGIKYLIEGYNHFLKNNPQYSEIKLIIAGTVRLREGVFKIFEKKDLDYLAELKELSQKFVLNRKIFFLGEIENKYIYTLLKNSKIIVMPYTNTESSGVLNQALVVNVPIIASNIGGFKETLGKSGILVEPRNYVDISKQLSSLCNNKKYYKKIIRNYITLNDNLKGKNTIKNTLNIYYRLINNYEN